MARANTKRLEELILPEFWWGVGNGLGDFEAVGIHGQIIRVSPADDLVIVYLSSWPAAEGETIGGYVLLMKIFLRR